jgi:hypothetical protein
VIKGYYGCIKSDYMLREWSDQARLCPPRYCYMDASKAEHVYEHVDHDDDQEHHQQNALRAWL